jgi:poly-gamma-glutamate capsule biosynthesis protein CapA/YwtB (metallophosphatase superfamily)
MLFVCFSRSVLLGQEAEPAEKTSILFFGDVNLGRSVGQQLLKGDVGYPFRFVMDSLAKGDAVFVNLESQLSEQNGETQHPKYNLIFCGPPAGAKALREAHVSIVSTANNHAYDYGDRALRETILNLDSAGIAHVGTAADSIGSFEPVILDVRGIKLGFLAYTQFMNFRGNWTGHVALFNAQRVAEDIAALRRNADVVIVSYHGGGEYVDRPPQSVKKDFLSIAEAGADLVVGHHPHYVQGIEWHNKALLLYSLGNFVFYQPQLEWTQRGLGVEIVLARHDSTVTIDRVRLMALRAGLEPSFLLSSGEEEAFFKRLQKLSPAKIYQKNGAWFVQSREINE